MMVATSLLAQPATNPPAAPAIETPAPAPLATNVAPAATASPGTNAPAAKKKKAAPKKQSEKPSAPKPAAAELRTVPLVAGPAVVEANHVNVRGQPKLKSEVVTRLNKGQSVTVVEEIVHNNSGADEPSAWAKILLPTNTHVYVNSRYINGTNQTVLPKKLNLRSGPGENYSVLGTLVSGDAVKQTATKGDWLQIEPPANAYAFVASQFLKQEAPGAVATTTEPTPAPATPTEPKPTPATVTEPPTIAAAATENPTPQPGAAPTPTETPSVTNATPETATEPATPPAEEPPPKRIVQREGKVRGTTSIQAPTKFALYSPENGRTIDYLYTSSPNLDLRRYKGLEIVVTGEESLEERWGNTPVITIQKIQVLEEAP